MRDSSMTVYVYKGVDIVQRIHEEVRIDLCLQIVQFCLQPLALQLFQVAVVLYRLEQEPYREVASDDQHGKQPVVEHPAPPDGHGNAGRSDTGRRQEYLRGRHLRHSRRFLRIRPHLPAVKGRRLGPYHEHRDSRENQTDKCNDAQYVNAVPPPHQQQRHQKVIMKREKQRKGQYAEPEMENAAPTYPAAVVVPEERHDEYHRPQQPIDAVFETGLVHLSFHRAVNRSGSRPALHTPPSCKDSITAAPTY